jgi:phthalate 4,5-cis-dihydrodiol dehydrogenase
VTEPRALGVGMLGTGRIAASHARAIRGTPGAVLRAVADLDETRRSDWLAKHAADRAVASYDDYRDLLADDTIDLVIVALPHWLHGEAAVAAANAGKHVLVEKPMAITLEECDQMIEAARSAGVVLAVGHMMHFHPLVVEAKRRIDSGAYGPIVWGSDVVYAPRPFGANPEWLYDRECGGGQLLANGTHLVDRLLWTVAARPVAVSGIVGTYFNRHDERYRADDGSLVFIRFDTGQAATFHLTGHVQGSGPEGRADYVCERGLLRYSVKQLFATDPTAPADQELHEVLSVDGLDPFTPQLQDMVSAIRGGGQVAVPGEWGRLVVQVLLAAEESSRTGHEVRL